MIRPLEISCDGPIHAVHPEWHSTTEPAGWIQAEVGPEGNGVVLDGILVSQITKTNLQGEASHFCSFGCLAEWLEKRFFAGPSELIETPPQITEPVVELSLETRAETKEDDNVPF